MTHCLDRIAKLTHPSSEQEREALSFNLERAAWTMLEMANTLVYELRLGIPKRETAQAFDILHNHRFLSSEDARKLKQLSEFRNLSARDTQRIDWNFLGSDLRAEVALFLLWLEAADAILSSSRPAS
jgi:uncharacterized protein YutE (UPF0331/DUF86 family)